MKAKILKTTAFLAVFTNVMAADSLYFSSGVVSNNLSDVTLTLVGPTNLVCEVHRLNRTNQVWDVMGNVTLSSGGTATYSTTLHEGIYGFYRAKSTNGNYFSTNAFGAVAGHLNAQGKTMIGNPFPALGLTDVFPSPASGTKVYYWDNGSSSYDIATYAFGSWQGDAITIGTEDGVIVENPSTNQTRYLVSGLFTTNTLTKSLPSGLSIISSPLYHLETGTWVVDRLNTNQLGGLSNIPVQSSGFNPQCNIYQMINAAGDYNTNVLTSGNLWQRNGSNVEVELLLTEGFWINKPTNATWTVSRTIW